MFFIALSARLKTGCRHLIWLSLVGILFSTVISFSPVAMAQSHTDAPAPAEQVVDEAGAVNGHEEGDEEEELAVESSLEPVEASGGLSLPWLIVIAGLVICGGFFYFFLKQVATDHHTKPKK